MKIPTQPPLNLHALLAPDDGDDAMAMHRFHARRTWRSEPGLWARLALLGRSLVWPLRAEKHIFKLTRRYGEVVERTSGKTPRTQRREQRRLAWRHGISPKSYYLFQLHRPENRERAQQYIHRYETKGQPRTYKAIAADYPSGSRILRHKDRFHRRCREHRLATAPIGGVISREGFASWHPSGALPEADLFIKPRTGRGGRGTQIWRYLGGDRYARENGVSMRGRELIDALRHEAKDGALLVQPRLVNHPELHSLCGDVFSTARIMTCLDETGEPEVTCAVFRIAVDSTTVDNIHRGGVAAGIDLTSGEIGDAQALSPIAERISHHPRTGDAIRGRKIPDWEAAKALAVQAHRVIPELTVIGWDVGFTREGPVLVEGNSAPCVHLLQKGLGAPLGGTRFARLLAHHIRRIEDA